MLQKQICQDISVSFGNFLPTTLRISESVFAARFVIHFEGALSGLKQFLVTESPLKMMKIVF